MSRKQNFTTTEWNTARSTQATTSRVGATKYIPTNTWLKQERRASKTLRGPRRSFPNDEQKILPTDSLRRNEMWKENCWKTSGVPVSTTPLTREENLLLHPPASDILLRTLWKHDRLLLRILILNITHMIGLVAVLQFYLALGIPVDLIAQLVSKMGLIRVIT